MIVASACRCDRVQWAAASVRGSSERSASARLTRRCPPAYVPLAVALPTGRLRRPGLRDRWPRSWAGLR